MKYDYLVVGSGIFGATFAQQAKEKGKSVLVIDKRDHVAGNVYTKSKNGINVHMYGCHIWHTAKKKFGIMSIASFHSTTTDTKE